MNQSNDFTRRNFLKASAAGMTLTAANLRSIAAVSPNEKINVGVIGVGGMGTSNMTSFIREDDAEIAAVCDVDSDHLAKAAGEAEKRQDRRPAEFKDFRKLLERNDIDAVCIATPDHWHAIPFVQACEAGKDVYVEKPLSHTIEEGRIMLEAAHKYKRVVQLGTVVHNDYGTNYRRCVELVQSGNLGKISRVQLWKSSTAKGLGNPADTNPPDSLDYDFWLGPAPKRPYNPNRSHFNFRYFWDYSGGYYIDFWCHITDVTFWAMDLGAPETVSATGGKFFLKDNTETPDTMEILFTYPDMVMSWSVHPNGFPYDKEMGGIGCAFIGEKATLVTNYGKQQVYVDGKEVEDFPRPEETIPDPVGHRREFLDCVKSRELTSCNIDYAHRLTKTGHLGNIAYRVGETLVWDDKKERVVGNREANKLVKYDYRKPWKL